jgi:CRP-like cAMP-binding protein
MDSTEFLRTIALFGGLEDDELLKVGLCLEEETHSAGQLIVREGEQAHELYIVKQGRVEVFKERTAQGGGKAVIATLERGECFGEMSLIDIMPRSASVRAIEDTVVLSLSYVNFHGLCSWRMKTYTVLVMNVAREISRRLRMADAILAEYNITSKGDPPSSTR